MKFEIDMLERLHALQSDSNATLQQQHEAKSTIAEIEDDVVAEYLALPDNSWKADDTGKHKAGQPRYDSYGVLYARTLIGANCAENILGVPDEADKVGTVLLHRGYITLGH